MKSVRGSILRIFILALSLSLLSASFLIDKAMAAPWPCTIETEIGENLPTSYEPSGIVWSAEHNSLFLVSDNGYLTQLDTDGNIASSWAVGGDLEGVTLVERRGSYLYLGIEKPDDYIKEFDLSTGSLTGNSWSLTAWMTGPENSGLEALTFVPDGYHPYDYDLSSSGGLFYAGLQADGRIYVFNVDLSVSGSVSHVATLTPKPGTGDISGLHFCRETTTLYAIYDSAGLMLEMTTDGTILNEYTLPGNDQEGVTVIPSGSGSGKAYIAEDAGPELWRYEPYPTACIGLDASPPSVTARLVIIHHSCGSNWLANGNGNLGTKLNGSNYYVTETDYGWDAEPGDNLGNDTDTTDWPYWFNDTKMPYVYSNSYHSAYTNTIADPGGENEIIVFKSCYPCSEVGSSIDDEKAIYNSLLPYYSAHTDKLFILVTPPGETDVSSYLNTKELNDWLLDEDDGWLAGYGSNNVKVFDFYCVLSETDSHHRLLSGNIKHVFGASYDGTSPYHDGDNHPNAEGNQKATSEFLLLLNTYYHQWKGAAASLTTVQTDKVTGVMASSAVFNGTITDLGGASCDQRGFDYRLQGTGTWDQTAESGSYGTGSFSRSVSSLAPDKTYEYRSKAHNSAGWGYGSTMTFTTSSSEPNVQTDKATGVMASSAVFNGTITDLGGASCDQRGFDYRLQGTGTWDQTAESGSYGTGSFSRSVSSLAPGKTYEYRSKAHNSAGWGYGSTMTFTTSSAADSSSTYYLAEGSTDWGFSTWISILNPNNEPVTAQVFYMTDQGPVRRGGTPIPADSIITINPEADLGAEDFSTSVVCLENKPIAVERTMLWNGPDIHTSIGVEKPSDTWYFAEGSSNWGFETWLLIQNRCEEEAECQITYMTEGGLSIPVSVVIPPSTRHSYNMADFIGADDASIKVTSNKEIICERAMYRNNRREGHCSVGAVEPSTDYFLAEGSTDWGFTTYLLVQNPNDSPVKVHADYETTRGTPPCNPEHHTLPPHSRKTIKVNDVLGACDFSIHIVGDLPIIAERAMYWDNGTGEACHASLGLIKPYNKFYVPFGKTSDGWETFVLVQNSNGEDIDVAFKITGLDAFTDRVPANSRKTYNLSDITEPGDLGLIIESEDKIMVEKALYFDNRSGGSDTIGVPIE
ncbi:MAG: SdiA-regulated domain-containing protein [Actinomycetota bacterium]|nr:SdiA-regulated domain-containing protein [Actinomycetota bacterium]